MRRFSFLFALAAFVPHLHGQPYTFVTIAGKALQFGHTDGTNDAALFGRPQGVAADSLGNIYVADTANNSIRRIAPAASGWVVTTLAGTPPFSGFTDGTNSDATFSSPRGIVAAPTGELYVADFVNKAIRKLTSVGTNWVVTTLSHTGESFGQPYCLAMDSAGNLYFTDWLYGTVCRMAPSGTNWVVKILAGSPGAHATVDGTNSDARFFGPQGIAVDGAGNLYVADWFGPTVRKVSPVGTNWVVTTIAGTNGGVGNVDGINGDALFSGPGGVAIDNSGVLFIGDEANNSIRKIKRVGADWVLTTLAGFGPNDGRGITDGTGSDARFNWPNGVAVDNHGNLYVADQDNHTIRGGRQFLPSLQVARDGSKIVLSWPAVAKDFKLESSDSLAPSATWVPFPGDAVVSGSSYMMTNDISGGTAFYRLRL